MKRLSLPRNELPPFCFICGDTEEGCKLVRGGGCIVCIDCLDIQHNMQ
jgi:hypothetical protein